ncbi:AAA family ATPase [Pseudomarimonas arenosa]|uniref:AAA family ATPase n=1 Tax=Pseudomarimonas arenosa TaxID=2774145 RepID=A0AAW3ZTL0_9GAMM|nr:AAA family ATPase [Pseudomarimonas arenosa]MBD8528145.1 AAA family ATPase [Pseudomarimonas arenosa]
MLTTLAVANYRSLHSLVIPLQSLNVVTGANGSGKSNLYRALRLLAETAADGVAKALAREGGLGSALWAGPETLTREMRAGQVAIEPQHRQESIALRMGFASETFGYALDLGYPKPSQSAFSLDPEIKRECIWSGPFLRPANLLVDRRGPAVRIRRDRDWALLDAHLDSFDSMLRQLADPERAPEVLLLREQLRGWRFYDHFRTDVDAPARQSRLATRTPVLNHDGSDLAAAWQTILEIGDHEAVQAALTDAFPGAEVRVEANDGRFSLWFHQPGLLRPLAATELSDGTLRYLLWIAALHTPRPPSLMVLNEPEASLHPDLLPALARLIIDAAGRSQVWVISHASRLIAALEASPHCHSLCLERSLGETRLRDQRPLDEPPWHWPKR